MYFHKILLIKVAFLALVFASCGKNENEYLNTNDYDFELMQGSLASRSEVELDKDYYVTTGVLNVRSSDEFPSPADKNVVGQLRLGDRVRVINNDGLNKNFVEIQVIDSESTFKKDLPLYVSYKFLDKKVPQVFSESPYFIVQNIATEKLRVYQRGCVAGPCAHKMIFEAEMVVGEHTKDEETMTYLGNYFILKWEKFYQDRRGYYPSWWRDDYPAPPEAGKGALTWTRKKYMPYEKAEVRGAFGWYAAILGYNVSNGRFKRDPNGQWTHGTIGWGADKKKFIKKTKKFWSNVFSNPRSHGCSRLDNESIAYLRHILPEGTPLIKIYAKEEIMNTPKFDVFYNILNINKSIINDTWDYILTKDSDSTADYHANVNSPSHRILEKGTYEIDSEPTVIDYTPGEDLGRFERKTSVTGNIYGVDSRHMKGVFYIDTGLTQDYSHPKGLVVAGDKRVIVPSFMKN